jgi:hypothetical protein
MDHRSSAPTRADLDRTLAFTAVIELRPGLTADVGAGLTKRLAEAMSAEDPKDRWTWARDWLDRHAPIRPAAATDPRD